MRTQHLASAGLSVTADLSSKCSKVEVIADTFKPGKQADCLFRAPGIVETNGNRHRLEAVSVDGEIYLALEFVDADSVDDVIEANLKYWRNRVSKSKKSRSLKAILAF